MDVEISTTNRLTGAYTIEHLPTGKVYHGSTNHLYRRVVEHQRDLRGTKHGNPGLQALYETGGDLKLTFKETETPQEALILEQSLIDATPRPQLLNSSLDTSNIMAGLWKNPEKREAFKKARIGNQNAAGLKHTDAWKAEASERLQGNKHLLGHVHTEESRRKMSESRIGKKCSLEHTAASAEGRTRERVVIDGVTYQNAAAAALAIGLSSSGIKKRCNSENFPNYKLVPK